MLNSSKTYRKEPNYAYWKSKILDEDIVRIPILGFNLEHEYEELLKSNFWSNGKPYVITKIQQKTAFVLNEKGAIVEDETYEAVEEASESLEKPIPKVLHFDKPFFVFLRKKDNYPYFAAFIVNSDFMDVK